ncbi:hypothetical protein [Gordonia sp. (in: high G+C Gram-positive bacteria)]|uniref:hypothetical protein n=1 Tax=Gordonia sp. (in: high G+C Gram-positive bacteria) TaxID=84139 RepID=UPI0039E4A0D1
MAISVKLASTPEAWALDSPADVFEAATELAERGYRGAVNWALPSPEADDYEWTITLNAEGAVAPEVTAGIGDHLLLSAGVLRRLTPAEWDEVTK